MAIPTRPAVATEYKTRMIGEAVPMPMAYEAGMEAALTELWPPTPQADQPRWGDPDQSGLVLG